MSSEKTESGTVRPEPITPVNRIAGSDSQSQPLLVSRQELQRITDAAVQLDQLQRENGPSGIIYRTAIDAIHNLAITNPRIIVNLVGNATTLSAHYASSGMEERIPPGEAIGLLENSMHTARKHTAELLHMTQEEAGSLLQNPPPGMIGYFNRYWSDSYNEQLDDKGHIPLFKLPNGHEVDVLTVHRALSSEIAALTAKKGINMLHDHKQQAGGETMENPKENTVVNVPRGVQTPLALLLTGLQRGGRLYEKACSKARELGVTDEAAVDNLAGNAVGPLTLAATILERSPNDVSMLVNLVNSQISDCDDKKRTSLKKTTVRGIKPDADYPEGAIAFYDESFAGRGEGKMQRTMQTSYGSELIPNDIEQALIAEISKDVAQEARRTLSALDRDGFGAAFNAGMKRAG